jgi:hypothetical protein
MVSCAASPDTASPRKSQLSHDGQTRGCSGGAVATARPHLGESNVASRLLALLMTGLALSSSALAGTWHAERITSGSAPVRVERLWSKGPWLHAEVVFNGHPILTLVKADRYVMIDAITSKGISIQRSPKAIAQDVGRARPFGNEREAISLRGGEKVKTEGTGDAACDLYRLTDQAGRREVCVSAGAEPLPVFSRAWDRATSSETETRYLSWMKDVEIADAFFSADPRVALESFTYEAYLAKAQREPVGPAPALYPELLHGY